MAAETDLSSAFDGTEVDIDDTVYDRAIAHRTLGRPHWEIAMRTGATIGLLLLVSASLTLPAEPVESQDVAERVLSQPEMVFGSHGFTRVAGIRELLDRRVIVLDQYNQTIHVIDAEWETMRQVGRRGAGPREYLQPLWLFSLPGDSSAVYDPGTGLLLVITPDAEPGERMSATGSAGEGDTRYPGIRRAAGIMLHSVRAIDGSGYHYTWAAPIVSTNGELQLVDSVAIERWSLESPKRDTVGFMPFELHPNARISLGGYAHRPDRPTAFRARSHWAIASDGRLAIVHNEPYRVDFIDPTGGRRLGEPIPYQRLRVTDEHKEQWRESVRRPAPALVATRDGQTGRVMMTPDPIEPEWPRYMPPMEPGRPRILLASKAAHFDMDGMLWVQRSTPADQPPRFDVIDGNARVVGRVQLPPKRRLVGFGRGSVYLVRVDEVDLEYLERYRITVADRR